jgi:hypothetical protein
MRSVVLKPHVDESLATGTTVELCVPARFESANEVELERRDGSGSDNRIAAS